MTKCSICNAKMVKRTYKLKEGFKNYRKFNHCSISIKHSYQEESLKDIDLAIYAEPYAKRA